MKPGTRLVYEEDGFPRELASVEELRSAFAEGRLAPDAIVTVYREGSPAQARTASELLDSETSNLPVDKAPDEPEEDQPASIEEPGLEEDWDKEDAPASSAELFEPAPAPGDFSLPMSHEQLDEDYYPDHPDDNDTDYSVQEDVEGYKAPVWPKLLFVLALGALAWLVIALFPTGEPDEEADQLYVVTSRTNVRAEPSVLSEKVGQIERGAKITGTHAGESEDGIRWLLISSGSYAGRYLTMTNLSLEGADAPPSTSLTPEATPQAMSEEVYAPCGGPDCRTLDSGGWAGIVSGTTAGQLSALGFPLVEPGHYDGALDDTFSCNIYNLAGAPSALSVMLENGLVTAIMVSDYENGARDFRTTRGIGIGDTEGAVRKVYPDLEQRASTYTEAPDKDLFFWSRMGTGIKFEIRDGIVSGISVGSRSIEYVEGCL